MLTYNKSMGGDIMILEIEKPTLIFDKVYIENLKDRRIVLNSEIDESIIEFVSIAIRKFNDEDKDIPVEQRKPIELYISSPGGSAYDGFSAVNEIITSKTPVHAVCSGYVMSMGLAIFVASHKRFAFPYTNFMYHEVMGGAIGKNSEMERATAEGKRVQKMYDNIIVSQTKIDQKKLDAVKKKSLDWFFGSDEALDMGFIHEIIR